MALKIKKRCIRCMKYLREDGTCQNEKCVRYTKPKEPEKTADGTTAETETNTK